MYGSSFPTLYDDLTKGEILFIEDVENFSRLSLLSSSVETHKDCTALENSSSPLQNHVLYPQLITSQYVSAPSTSPCLSTFEAPPPFTFVGCPPSLALLLNLLLLLLQVLETLPPLWIFHSSNLSQSSLISPLSRPLRFLWTPLDLKMLPFTSLGKPNLLPVLRGI